jgi:hypothetical protein
MAVMIPHNYKGEDFQIVLSPSPDGNDKWVRCRISFNPINDKRFEADVLVAREFTGEEKFYEYICAETVSLYHKSLVKGVIIHSKFDENNNGK